MKTKFDLSSIDWRMSGWTPEYWRMAQSMEIGETPNAEVPAMMVKVPCSVQKALLDNNYIEDWNVGVNYRGIEWIEHRHWIFDVAVPDEVFADEDKKYFLNCEGLDFAGDIFFNGVKIKEFANSYLPVEIELKKPKKSGNWIRIAFGCAPAWQGQFGYTSQINVPKVRFYYSWDWTCRLVQTGIWDKIYITAVDKTPFEYVDIDADADWKNKTGILNITGYFKEKVDYEAKVILIKDKKIIKEETVSFKDNLFTTNWDGFSVELWHPNLNGEQVLYDLEVVVYDKNGALVDKIERKIGFKNVIWNKCEGASESAGNWICVANGEPTFLQGCNWVPPYHNFADCKYEDYKALIDVYKDLGINLLRVWGGAVLEHEEFYNLCDEAGIFVWQEFPLSSSGIDNTPPFEKEFIDCLGEVAEAYIKRRKYHVSLLMWCGGNELFTDGHASSGVRPCDTTHPMLKNFKNLVEKFDARRRFIPSSPTGPSVWVSEANIGRGINENVHGPWKANTIEEWNTLFETDDSMFRAETGAPSCSSKDILDDYAGNLKPFPMENANVYWSRPFTWWLEIDIFEREMGKKADNVEEYIEWSQKRQAELLVKAIGTMKKRFPTSGGFVVWMGHDLYPCPANTSIIDYYRRPKPAAIALRDKVYRKKPSEIDI